MMSIYPLFLRISGIKWLLKNKEENNTYVVDINLE
jgi:hypothetical protein